MSNLAQKRMMLDARTFQKSKANKGKALQTQIEMQDIMIKERVKKITN
jgi:hypothetical protein